MPQKNQGVFRLGTEYTIDLKKSWALVPKLYFDFRGSTPYMVRCTNHRKKILNPKARGKFRLNI